MSFVTAPSFPTSISPPKSSLYNNFCLVLGGDLCSTWDEVLTSLQATTQADGTAWAPKAVNFNTASLPCILCWYFLSNSFHTKCEYMHSAMKPKSVDCYTLSGHVHCINTLSTYLPGSGGTMLYTMATTLKNTLFCLMLLEYEQKFTSSGHALDDDDYSYNCLAQFMDQENVLYNALQQA